MSTSIDRYLAAVKAAGSKRNSFNSYFIGTLSAKFDYNLTPDAWDDALNRATRLITLDEA